MQGFWTKTAITITCIVAWSWSQVVIPIIVGSQHLWITYQNNQQSILYIICYHIHGMKSWFHPSNVGHGHIFQMLKFQTRVAYKDHDTSDPSFQTLLEWNDWAPKHIKVNIQVSCMNIVLYSSWYQDSNGILFQK